jgi:YD repeat-containing protein
MVYKSDNNKFVDVNLTARTKPYTYDQAGRLISIDNPNPASATEPDLYISAIAYNALGRATSVAPGNGVVASYGYDQARGWLTASKVLRGASVLQEQSYARTLEGLITAITAPDPARSWTYGYDGLDRLILADNGSGITEDRSLPAPRKAARCVRGSKRSTGPFCRLRRRLSPYDAVDNMIYNSTLCAGSAASPNLLYPALGPRRCGRTRPTASAGLLTSCLSGSVKREGEATDFLMQDHKDLNRINLRFAPALTTRQDDDRSATSSHRFKKLERAKGIEPSYAAWEAKLTC